MKDKALRKKVDLLLIESGEFSFNDNIFTSRNISHVDMVTFPFS